MGSHRVAGAPVDFAALRSELQVAGDFAPEVSAEAERAATHLDLPDADATDIAFVTVDPAGSRDLDQAVHIARNGDGYLVSYAIADVASFVSPDSALDEATHRRGETLYFPDARVPLHPPVLSEGAASLLPGQVRPAVLWQFTLDHAGEVSEVQVRRARVRSTAQLDYDGLQAALADRTAPDAVSLLAEVGELRLALARRRHAINLDLPEQVVARDGMTGWTLRLRVPLPVESYNAEISLLTGMCAARIMLDGGYGILRTVPPPAPGAVDALRRAARALGVQWPHGAQPGDVLAAVDRSSGRQVAFIEHAVALLRGAGYTTVDTRPPEQPLHAGIGAPYAHVTAPLRRLVDRYGSEICLALHAGEPVPTWVRDRLPQLPEEMAEADRRAHEIDRAVVDATEAWLLRGRVGTVFAATVIDANEHSGTIVIDEPAVRAPCDGQHLPVGERVSARLVEADVVKHRVRFERA
ncbi:RNB domain-containing ribonuclease [Jatrophihabitans cynanchi]|uniref:RNB domain-containing ribonuclease n=1 Tax=Jatrophihabitans cynanchi TaxID=2944128 RepID=A0ABY7JVJ6_9ACTN|nr:RNB domain-containing ribonuclease [Jatrophihabitans sp. SB3-54]WAX56561.1 RNB domain-containing ribonuclease [Jatrophihabitans sp. SB3-54]